MGRRKKDGVGLGGGDLSQISVMIGLSVCPSPKGDGMVLSPFLGDGVVEFAANPLCPLDISPKCDNKNWGCGLKF